MIVFLRKIANCPRGATAVEYGLILALIFMAMVVAVQNTASSSNKMWNNVSTKTGAVL